MAVLIWHLLTKEADYLWARPALVAHIKALRKQEMSIAEQAERAYEHFVGQARPKPRTLRARAAPVM